MEKKKSYIFNSLSLITHFSCCAICVPPPLEQKRLDYGGGGVDDVATALRVTTNTPRPS